MERISRLRLKLADRIIIFCLDHRIKNLFITYLFFKIFQILIRNVYILKYNNSNHHYIPQFILKEFRIPKSGQIFQYTHKQKPKRVSIYREAACLPDLYTIKDKESKTKSDFLENQIFAYSLEKYASRIIHEMIRIPDRVLTGLERSLIVSFLSFQYVRTPKFFELIKITLEYLHLEKGVEIDEMVNDDFYRKAFFENEFKIDPEEVFKFASINELMISNAGDLILKIAIQIGNYLSEVLSKFRLQILGVRGPSSFYLTDNPAVLYDREEYRSIGAFLWHINSNTLAFMPICPKKCVYLVLGETPPPGEIGYIIENVTPKTILKHAYSHRDDVVDLLNI